MNQRLSFKGYQAKQLRLGLSSAYRNLSSLKLLLREEMDIRLEEEILVNQPYKNVVGDLIDWVDGEGRLAELIHTAVMGNPNNPDLKLFRETFGIKSADVSRSEPIGSAVPFDWLNPVEDGQLQSFWRSPTDLWDVGFLNKGLAQVSSICRVDGGQGGSGTGFMIQSDLVLTNCHVIFGIDGEPSEQADLSGITLKFRCLSDAGEEQGILIHLADQALVKWSPIDQLDYALLRIQPPASRLEIRPVIFSSDRLAVLPARQDGLHILQHPGGDTLKLALAGQGVTGVYHDWSRIQYVSQTYGGSSGAPCFNDDWELVAMHQMECSKSWGTVRQGILFQAIYRDIVEKLS
jgi:endonuclease G, mitochondrial